MSRVLVVGAGLIGTSLAMALSAAGYEVLLDDRDAERVRLAVALGAGRPADAADRADVAVAAVSPRAVSQVIADLQRRQIAATFTDVSSVKTEPQAQIEALGCDMTTFVGGHPVAGRERSGPVAARPDLFQGRPWVLVPYRAAPEAVHAVRELAVAAGATPVEMSAVEHDRALAAVSHAPQLVASALAASLLDLPPDAVALAGQGLRDMVRIAASDPVLWADIAAANAAPLAAALERVAARLSTAARALAASATVPLAADGAAAPAGSPPPVPASRAAAPEKTAVPPDVPVGTAGTSVARSAVHRVVTEGNAGHARIPGKHGGRPTAYRSVVVVVPDAPGQLAAVLAAAADAAVNVEDISVEHVPGRPVGVIELWVRPDHADVLHQRLVDGGWDSYIGE